MRVFLLNATTTFNSIFWILLIAFTVIIVAVTIYTYYRNRSFHLDFTQTLVEKANNINELEYYTIDNLDEVVEILDSSEHPLLSSTAYKIKSDSDRLYQGQWISDPDNALKPEKVLDKSQYRSYTYEIIFYIFTTGVLVSIAFLLMSISGTGGRSSLSMVALVPFITSLISSIVLFGQIKNNRDYLTRALNHLSENIKERVPVFRELAGTAALIESFFRYDRSMSDSVARLANVVEKITSIELADKLAENVKVVMQEEVTPAIIDATTSLTAATAELDKERTTGLNKLADQYSAAVTKSMTTQLQPFYQELENMATNLFESNKYVELTLETIDKSKEESLSLQNRLTSTLESLNTANKTWSENLDSIAFNVESLSSTSDRIAKLQTGAENDLNTSLNNLRETLSGLEANVENLTAKVYQESTEQITRLEQTNQENDKLLNSVKELGELFTEQADALNKHNLDISREVGQLNDGLNASVQNFTSGINSGVINILEDFDDSLAEITNRLSDTTAEINDAVDSWSREMQYQENRAQRRSKAEYRSQEVNPRDAEAREQLMNFLLSDDERNMEDIDGR